MNISYSSIFISVPSYSRTTNRREYLTLNRFSTFFNVGPRPAVPRTDILHLITSPLSPQPSTISKLLITRELFGCSAVWWPVDVVVPSISVCTSSIRIDSMDAWAGTYLNLIFPSNNSLSSIILVFLRYNSSINPLAATVNMISGTGRVFMNAAGLSTFS